ncbi:hypothetical protein B0J11DRAFT_261644 [Dendryphion nanum]|uniref:Uncharacterized protein n=1 Tax=Dendryphion nanum TaxID=256645 RepID=A0A9P9IRQ9_9PLEO|nr:hypothetical protein B0J11DRAFT_261644 [Dendryphion nanum]
MVSTGLIQSSAATPRLDRLDRCDRPCPPSSRAVISTAIGFGPCFVSQACDCPPGAVSFPSLPLRLCFILNPTVPKSRSGFPGLALFCLGQVTATPLPNLYAEARKNAVTANSSGDVFILEVDVQTKELRDAGLKDFHGYLPRTDSLLSPIPKSHMQSTIKKQDSDFADKPLIVCVGLRSSIPLGFCALTPFARLTEGLPQQETNSDICSHERSTAALNAIHCSIIYREHRVPCVSQLLLLVLEYFQGSLFSY